MILDALAASDCETVRHWRNADRMGLRTPYMLSQQMQADFYQRVVSDRRSPHRYYAVRDDNGIMVAMVGLTDIEWENGHAEISLIVDPAQTGHGIGAASVRLILEEAFHRMRLVTVFGEVYDHNPARAFWSKLLKLHSKPTHSVKLPRRKFWDGQLHGSILFWFTTEAYHA